MKGSNGEFIFYGSGIYDYEEIVVGDPKLELDHTVVLIG